MASKTIIQLLFSFVCWNILVSASSKDGSIAVATGNLFELFKEALTLWGNTDDMKGQVIANCPQLYALSDAQFGEQNSTFLGSLETLGKLCSVQDGAELSLVCQGAIGISNYLCDISNDIRQQDANQALPKPTAVATDPKQWTNQSSICKSLDDSEQLVTFLDNVSKYSNPNTHTTTSPQIRNGSTDNCLATCNGTNVYLCRMILVTMRTSIQFAEMLENSLEEKQVDSIDATGEKGSTSTTLAAKTSTTGSSDAKTTAASEAPKQQQESPLEKQIDNDIEKVTRAAGKQAENANDISDKADDSADKLLADEEEEVGNNDVDPPVDDKTLNQQVKAPDAGAEAETPDQKEEKMDEAVDDNEEAKEESEALDNKEQVEGVPKDELAPTDQDAKEEDGEVKAKDTVNEPPAKSNKETVDDKSDKDPEQPEVAEQAKEEDIKPSKDEEIEASDNEEVKTDDVEGAEDTDKEALEAADKEEHVEGTLVNNGKDEKEVVLDSPDKEESVKNEGNDDETPERKEEEAANVPGEVDGKDEDNNLPNSEDDDAQETDAEEAAASQENARVLGGENVADEEEVPVEESSRQIEEEAVDERERILMDEDVDVEDAYQMDRNPSPRIISHKVVMDRYMHEPQDTHFLMYFIICAVLSFTGYVIMMRWNRIIPLVIRRSGPSVVRRGRSNRSYWLLSSRYRKLVNNLEEVVSPSQSVKTSSSIY